MKKVPVVADPPSGRMSMSMYYDKTAAVDCTAACRAAGCVDAESGRERRLGLFSAWAKSEVGNSTLGWFATLFGVL